MKAFLALVLASVTSAQVLHKGIGSLPSCVSTCSVLQDSAKSCGGKSSTSLGVWSCFCKDVYSAAGGNTAAICTDSCSTTDDASVATWFTANCGSDNGQSEHGGGSGGTATTSAAAASSAPPSSSSDSGTDSGNDVGAGTCSGSWWHCHYQWIIMVIVIAVGLVVLGFGGRWLKKRHDRKRDENRSGFNSGITSRTAPVVDDKAPSHSPARTRDAFMPYGYQYSKSESKQMAGSNGRDMARGSSPVDEIERADAGGARQKLKRVLVREKGGR